MRIPLHLEELKENYERWVLAVELLISHWALKEGIGEENDKYKKLI